MQKFLLLHIIFLLIGTKCISQEIKNYKGDLYKNCYWADGSTLIPIGNAGFETNTYFTNQVVQVVDPKHGVKVDTSKKELIGFLIEFSIALKDTDNIKIYQPNYAFYKDSIIRCYPGLTYWKNTVTGEITNEAYANYFVTITEFNKRTISYNLFRFTFTVETDPSSTRNDILVLKGEIRLKTKNKSPFAEYYWSHDSKKIYKLIKRNN